MALRILLIIQLLIVTCTIAKTSSPKLTRWDPVGEPCEGDTTECNGCKKIRICIGGQFVESTCEALSPKTPFCNKDAKVCDSDESLCPVEPDSSENKNAKCIEPGVVPDYHNCRKYVMCVATDEVGKFKGYSYSCDKSTAFDHVTKTCKYLHKCTDFGSTNLCTSVNRGKIINFPPDRSVYGICPTSGENAIIGKCQNNYEFDTNVGGCKPSCKSAGRILDSADDDYFYDCTLIGTKYKMERQKCPPDTKFRKELGYCTI